jgi:hypothetical protein
MAGILTAVLVYGFGMGNQNSIIYYKYLEDKFPGVSQYASETIKTQLCEAIYGISCTLDKKSGQIIISDEEKEKVKVLYDKYIDYLKNNLSNKKFNEEIKYIELGFRLGITGIFSKCHRNIILDQDWKEKKENWEEDEESDTSF